MFRKQAIFSDYVLAELQASSCYVNLLSDRVPIQLHSQEALKDPRIVQLQVHLTAFFLKGVDGSRTINRNFLVRRHEFKSASHRTSILHSQVVGLGGANRHHTKIDILVVLKFALALEGNDGNLKGLVVLRLDGDHVIEFSGLSALIYAHEFPVETWRD